MAHFCEHMLFMGSQYPEYDTEDIYSNHISENSGYSNAYTQLEHTNYNFEISYSGLEKALDLMAWSLHKPSLHAHSVKKEMNAIENEYKMNAQDDGVRMIQILQNTTVDPNHVFNRFMWGSKKSLCDGDLEPDDENTLVKELRDFFVAYYSADRMKLVVSVQATDE